METLNPGIYVITGILHFMSGANSHSNLGGNGVFFYLPSTATLRSIAERMSILLRETSTESGGGNGTGPGIVRRHLLYQATGNTTALTLQGGSTTYMEGSLYAPSAAVTVSNGSGATSIGGIYASSLTVTGGSSLVATPTTNEGTLVTTYPKLVQ